MAAYLPRHGRHGVRTDQLTTCAAARQHRLGRKCHHPGSTCHEWPRPPSARAYPTPTEDTLSHSAQRTKGIALAQNKPPGAWCQQALCAPAGSPECKLFSNFRINHKTHWTTTTYTAMRHDIPKRPGQHARTGRLAMQNRPYEHAKPPWAVRKAVFVTFVYHRHELRTTPEATAPTASGATTPPRQRATEASPAITIVYYTDMEKWR